jgi:hypothetical protein
MHGIPVQVLHEAQRLARCKEAKRAAFVLAKSPSGDGAEERGNDRVERPAARYCIANSYGRAWTTLANCLSDCFRKRFCTFSIY